MSLFSGMQIKQKATEEDKVKLRKAQDDKLAQSKQPHIDSIDPCGVYDTGPSAGITSQFDFIAAAEMGQNLASQSSSRTEVPVKVDCEKSSSTDQTMGESSPSIGKRTPSIIGQGNALVDRIKKSLHIDPPTHDPSESSSILQDTENLHMMEASNFGEITETGTETVSCGEGSRDLLVEKDNQLVHALDYSAEEKLQILQQGYNTRMANISEKKELLKSEVSKITAGRVEGILSITSKHNQLCQLQQQQLHAIETEDYVKAESLALQCSALESELEILPDMSLNTHYIMEELLKSAIELQKKEQATREKVIKETKRLHQEVMELEERFDTRLSEMEGKDKDKIEKCKLEVEKEESHFKEDMEKLKRQEAELEQKISGKSQEHEKKKSVLETERAKIQTEIKQQEELINRLRQEEAELAASIAQENEEIATIVGSFQSEMKDLEMQRQNNLSRSNKLEENKREVRTIEEKRNQELAQYNEERDRHKQLKLQIEETLKAEEKLYDESRLENVWCVQAPPSFNPTKELAEATSNLKDHDSSIKILRKELLQGQKKVVSLKKQVSDLEGHIAELEQAKKLSVEGKQFSEAKSISEEIQSVTREGQQVQEELENLIKKNQEVVNELQEMQTENQKLKAHEEKERNFWEKQLRDRLLSHFQTLYDDRDTKLVQINCAAAAILSSELHTSSLLLKHLCQKQDFSLPQAISDRIEEVLDGLCREDGEG